MRAGGKKRIRQLGFLYILPWLAGFLLFRLYPFLSSLVYSFTNFRLFGADTDFVGLANYQAIFTDEKILAALGTTLLYVALTVPLKLSFALAVALLLRRTTRATAFFRTAFYLPSLLGGSVAVAVLWRAVFRDDGPVNALLALCGVQPVEWMGNPHTALALLVLLRVWQFGSAMILFLAALQTVPRELYEAAALDGAGAVRRFFCITLPMLTPVLFLSFVTQTAQTFQEFNAPYIITQGGPRNATTLFSLLIYNRAFAQYDMGMASAMAWVLFGIVSLISLLAFRTQKRWVYYGDEGGGA